MSSALRLENVDKKFGGVVASKNVSFSMEAGTIHGLIGPNGAGKTTTMNIISGIYAPDSGRIFLGDTDITHVPAHKRPHMGLARTFQTPRFLERSTICDNMLLGTDLAENIGYFRSFFSRASRQFTEELEYYMQYAGFDIDLEKDITSLTYGQMKILEIVRSLLTHPKVMLVDEPAAGLISKEQNDAMKLLSIAAKEKNIAVLLIEHSMDLVMSSCEQIVVLNFGEVIAQGTPEEISSNEDVIAAYLWRDIDA